MSEKTAKPLEEEKKDVKNGKNGKEKEKDAFEFKEEDLSAEDKELKERLDLFVERLSDPEKELRVNALNMMKDEIKSATSSMTSVPKPLKFLKPHYEKLKEIYTELDKSDSQKREFADVLGILSITMGVEGECLSYILEGTQKNLESWGHEFLRTLGGELGSEYQRRMTEQPTEGLDVNVNVEDLISLSDVIIPFNMSHNAEPEAVDLLWEIERLGKIIPLCTPHNYERVCLYLTSIFAYAADTEEMISTLRTAYDIYIKMNKHPEALRVALKLNDQELMQRALTESEDVPAQMQMAFMLGRQRVNLEVEDEELTKIISNERVCETYLKLARDLDVMEPKTPDQIFKAHLQDRKAEPGIESAKHNLACAYANAFVNAGFGTDQYISTSAANEWIHNNKDNGKQIATASIGMVLLWDLENITSIDKFQYTNDDFITAGAYMAFGMVGTGIKSEVDPAFGLLVDALDTNKEVLKSAAIIGLTFAYAGSARKDILEVLSPIVLDSDNSMEVSGLAALGIGLVYIGTSNDEVANLIAQALMDRSEVVLTNSPFTKMFALGLGLNYLGQQEKIEAALEIVGIVPSLSRYLEVLLKVCGYAGSGNVLKVQEMLHVCVEEVDKEKDKGGLHHILAVLGVAAIALGEEIGSDMSNGTMQHLLQYGEPAIRKTVPLAMGLLSVSNPQLPVMDTLSKLSHDQDDQVAQTAIFALGLIGAGTNNSRLADILRQLAGYYAKDPDHLFIVRIAQGILHIGKGLLTLSPHHSQQFLLSNVGLGGLLTVLLAMTDMNNLIHSKYHYFLFYLVLSMYPRMLVTLNEEQETIEVQVRVGQAVDVVAQAGHPKTITGFQTHTSPVLLAAGERAELATEEYIPLTNILENYVILKKNPDYKE